MEERGQMVTNREDLNVDRRSDETIEGILDHILDERKERTQNIQTEVEKLKREAREIDELNEISRKFSQLQPEEMESLCGKRVADRLMKNRNALENCQVKYKKAVQAAEALSIRFQRPTINLVVIGKTGAGKSKFLQSISGLDDNCIPSLPGSSCTGVTLIIENTPNGKTRALITFKTEREVIENLAQEVRSLAEKIKALKQPGEPFRFPDEIKDLDEGKIRSVCAYLKEEAIKCQSGSMKAVACNLEQDVETMLTAYINNRKEWQPYLGRPERTQQEADLSFCDPELKSPESDKGQYILENPARIREYVSKHDGNGQYYYRYIAVKSVVVQTELPGFQAKIRLVDTVGIGDPSADTKSRLEDAIRSESDGVIVISQATERVNNQNNIDEQDIDFLNSLKEIMDEHRDSRPDLWMFYLMNNKSKNVQSQKFAEGYLQRMAKNYSKQDKDVFGRNGIQKYQVINVADKEPVEKAVQSFLEYISHNLHEIDNTIERNKDALVREARLENARLQESFKELRNNVMFSQQNLNYIQILMEERIGNFKEALSRYSFQIEERGRTAKEREDGSFLRQRLNMVQRLKNGEHLQELNVDLQGIISESCKKYPVSFAQVRIDAIRRLPEIIRHVATMPSGEQKHLEREYKEDLAKLFVKHIGIDLQKAGNFCPEPFQIEDRRFFQKTAELILANVGKSEEIREAFESLDQFRLDEMNGMTKTLFIHNAALYLIDDPYQEDGKIGEAAVQKVYSEKEAILQKLNQNKKDIQVKGDVHCISKEDQERLRKELQEKLQNFITAVENSIGEETYLVSYYDQMKEELYHFMQVLVPELEGRWQMIFNGMKERGYLEEDEKIRKSLKLLEKVVVQLNDYFGSDPAV